MWSRVFSSILFYLGSTLKGASLFSRPQPICAPTHALGYNLFNPLKVGHRIETMAGRASKRLAIK